MIRFSRAMKSTFCIGAICILPVGAVLAQSSNSVSAIISSEEAKNELFGVLLSGETAQTKEPWSECIQPDGKTRYRFSGVELLGKLEIHDDGQACFSYRADDFAHESCFRVSRTKTGYTFWGGVEGVFTATHVQHNVKTCPSDVIPTS
ncbi:hypothetical protein [Hirschia litorea]|uniref:Uncharacterized protein n=1 Tax=Hirschia litorea TaxID=1199156 RepID=A0ABW2IIZ9_9PROT